MFEHVPQNSAVSLHAFTSHVPKIHLRKLVVIIVFIYLKPVTFVGLGLIENFFFFFSFFGFMKVSGSPFSYDLLFRNEAAAVLSSLGNDFVNSLYEANMKTNTKPKPNASRYFSD